MRDRRRRLRRPVRLRRWIALGLGLCLGASAGCPDRREPDIAELSAVLSGTAERSSQGGAWQASRAGDRFRTGDGVRTSQGGGARLRFLAGGGLRMGPSTTIRFGQAELAVDGELEAEGEDAVVELVLGRAHIAAGSRVRIGRRGGQLRFDVLIGGAVVTRAGQDLEVTAGQALDLDLAGTRVERVPGSASATASAGLVATTPKPATAATAATTETGEAPSHDGGAADAGDTPAPDAIVGDLRGPAGRMRRASSDEWTMLPAGRREIPPAAEVSIPRGATLALDRGDQRAVVTGAAELVVAPDGPSGPLVEARRGRAAVRAAGADVEVRVAGGKIVARRGRDRGGSAADLRVDRSATSVRVTGGVVDVVGARGGRERLLAGQTGVVERGGGLRVFGRPPERGDFSIDAGRSATIHDPSPPTDVRIRFAGLCAEAGVVELAEGGSFSAARVVVEGRGAAIARFGRGGHRYRVRCLEGEAIGDAVVASGRLRVEKDGGTRPLARLAPNNTVDADGRRYTVLYQNRLPAITFRWPGAPEAAQYRLVLTPRQGRPIDLASPVSSRVVASGELAEGPYQFWFAAPELGRTSRRSTLTIDFDNAASSGYVQSPRPSGDWGGTKVAVSGAAIEGWQVAVAGTPLPLDRQHRFSTEVARAADENGIAVEFAHPVHGVHLYVRRARK